MLEVAQGSVRPKEEENKEDKRRAVSRSYLTGAQRWIVGPLITYFFERLRTAGLQQEGKNKTSIKVGIVKSPSPLQVTPGIKFAGTH